MEGIRQPQGDPSPEMRRLLHAANNRLARMLSHAEAGLLSGTPEAMRESLATICEAALELGDTLKLLRREASGSPASLAESPCKTGPARSP